MSLTLVQQRQQIHWPDQHLYNVIEKATELPEKHVANAFKCYDCGRREDKCNDPFNAKGVYTETCDGYCYKLKPATSNASAVMRGYKCSIDANLKSCKEGTIDGIVGKLCYCKGIHCNYALLVGSSIIVTAAAMIINIVL